MKWSKTSAEYRLTQLTDPFSLEQKKHRINRWSRAAEAEVSGLTDSFSHAKEAFTESVGDACGARKSATPWLPCTLWPIHLVYALWRDRISRSRQFLCSLEQRLVSLVGVINTPPPGHFKGVRAWGSCRLVFQTHSSALATKMLKRRLRQLT